MLERSTFSRRTFLQAAAALALTPRFLRAADDEPLRVCLVSGSHEYESDKSLIAFQEFVEDAYPVRCTRAFAEKETSESIPGLEAIDTTDVMLLFTRRLPLAGDSLERIKNYCLAGRPIVGVRTASHAVQTWLELDKEVLGGDYQGHFGHEVPMTIEVVADQEDHPLLKDFEPWISTGGLYKNPKLADDVTVLLHGELPTGEREPIAWTRKRERGQMFYTSLGAQKDFEEAAFLKLLARGLFWTAGRST